MTINATILVEGAAKPLTNMGKGIFFALASCDAISCVQEGKVSEEAFAECTQCFAGFARKLLAEGYEIKRGFFRFLHNAFECFAPELRYYFIDQVVFRGKGVVDSSD